MSSPVDLTNGHGVWDDDDWCNTTVDVQQLPRTGRVPTTIALGLLCKADGEKGGLVISAAGMSNVPTRRFHFPVYYSRAGQPNQDARAFLRADNVLLDNEGIRWVIQTVSNPGDTDEFLM